MKHLLVSLFVCALLAITAFNASAQHPAAIPGELLIQTTPDADVATLVRTLAIELGPQADLHIAREVAAQMHIWKLEFNPNQQNALELLKQVRETPGIALAQFNHTITNRATPNDAQFAQQWQYNNTGANGGVVGADLDAELAWDFTTGGLTALGDTIVVCVIDNAPDGDHEDLAANMWFNHHEIPNNGVDDDLNGFVDDYRGWNADQNNDDIDPTANSHGTAVCGIVGAKGDNGIGVTGVNWNVKVMAVVGGGDEVDALAAYAYPLALRKQWNETAGAQGAYVVATNASWGINDLDAADAPLWCAMYDSLGLHGVLNCGATANNDVDVDVVGDMPTSCGSDFLITVTNLRNNDVKEGDAGYGLTTIDLGAYGEDTYTLSNNDNYAGFGGTSGATPHVTGTIGLLYSAPCPELIALAAAAPDTVARLMKQFILNSVTPNASLNGITVTDGRLNMNGAMQELLAFGCGDSGCFQAFSLNVNGLTDANAVLQWNALSTATEFVVEYREAGAGTWNATSTTSMALPLTNLTACTDYEYRVRAICSTDTANYSAVRAFTTDGCCVPPSSFMVDSVNENQAIFSWNSVLAAMSYAIRYRVAGTATWTDVGGLTGTSHTLTGLASCTSYEVEITSECGIGTAPFGATHTFLTEGCSNCLQDYCESEGNSTTFEWIGNVAFGDLDNTSGTNSGYGDFTGNATATFYLDSVYTLGITPEYSGQQFTDNFEAWIDFNQDGDFDEPNEHVLSGSGNSTITEDVHIPLSADTGLARLRVVVTLDAGQSPCEESFPFGEVEDYCIQLANGIPDFVASQSVQDVVRLFPNPGNGNFTVVWNAKAAVNATIVDVVGALVWTGTVAPGNNRVQLENAAPGTYILRLQTAQGVVAKRIVVE